MKIDHKESFPDFGKQFKKDSKIDGYWGSTEMLKDIVAPFNLKTIKNKNIMELGTGSGRILFNLSKFKPKRLVGIEPSEAISIAKKNNKNNNVEFYKLRGEELNFNETFDYVFSLGVLHHIPNAEVVMKNIHKSLKSGGNFIFWVYGYEGNKIYIIIFNNLRRITRILPDSILRIFCNLLNICCSVYMFLCLFFNLPLKRYFFEVFRKVNWEKRNYIIFDQLNPSYSKYYKRKEIESLLQKCSFKDYQISSRHGYSWTVIAKK